MTSAATFQQQRTVTTADIDGLGHVNNVRFLHWIQDIAAAHWALLSANCALAKEVVWVVRRHEIDYHQPAYLNDRITMTTYVGESNGVISKRHTQLHNEQGKLLCEAVTHWCALQAGTGRLKRINDDLRNCLGL
jgi:acyl-CoA thioester hydrolase